MMQKMLMIALIALLSGCAGMYVPPCENSASVLDVGHVRDRFPCVGMCGGPQQVGMLQEIVYKRSVVIVDHKDDIQCQELTRQ